METTEDKFDALNFSAQLSETHKVFKKFEKKLSAKDKLIVSRFEKIFALLADKFESADLHNTSYKAFERVSTYTQSIITTIARMNQDNLQEEDRLQTLENFNSFADGFLEILPLIKATQDAVGLIEEAKEKLNFINSIASDVQEIKEASTNHFIDLENLKVDGQKLSQFLANKVIKNDFQVRAINEKWAARWWTTATWLFAAATIGLLVYTYIYQKDAMVDNSLNYTLLGTKILITITLGVISKWTSKRANRHLIEESKYHRLAVNAATMNSFIAPLNEADKSKVITTVAIKIFTEDTGDTSSTEYETPISDAIQTVAKNVKS